MTGSLKRTGKLSGPLVADDDLADLVSPAGPPHRASAMASSDAERERGAERFGKSGRDARNEERKANEDARSDRSDPSEEGDRRTSSELKFVPEEKVEFLGTNFTARRIASLHTLEEVENLPKQDHGEEEAKPFRTMIKSCSDHSLSGASAASGGGLNREESMDESCFPATLEEDPADSSWKEDPLDCSIPPEPNSGQPNCMLSAIPPLWAFVCGVLFSSAQMDPRQLDDFKSASAVGTVVYVVEGHSWLHHLFLNYLLLKYSLPIAGGAYSLLIVPYVSFLWPVWLLMRLLLDFGKSKEEREKRYREEAVTLVRNGQPLIVPVGYGSGQGEGGYEARELIMDIIATQRSVGGPICLCPLHAVWNRAPLEREGAGLLSRLTRRVFGPRRWPGALRFLASVLSEARDYVEVRGGGHINLSEWLLGYRAASAPSCLTHDAALADELLALVHSRFAAHWRQVTGPPFVRRKALLQRVLASSRVRDAIKTSAEKSGHEESYHEQQAARVLDKMAADYRFRAVTLMRLIMRWILSSLFQEVFLDESGLQSVQQAVQEARCPVVYIPTHKSHVDYLLLSYVLFARDMVVPCIAAGDNLAKLLGIAWVFRMCGAFYIRRTFGSDVLYKEIFREYVTVLLEEGFDLEFFIEGGRSRNGKIGQARLGLLGVAVDAVLSGRVPDLIVAPISMQYDRVVEGSSYSKQLLGAPKPRESLGGLLASQPSRLLFFSTLLRPFTMLWSKGFNCGNIVVKFAEPISVRHLLKQHQARGPGVDKTGLVVALAHRVTWSINQNTVIVPTCLVSTVLLTHSCRGISFSDLVEHVQWLTQEVLTRGGLVSPMEEAAKAVSSTLKRIDKLVKYPSPNNTLEPLLRPRDSRRLDLAYYRNQCLHIFVEEALVLCCLVSMKSEAKSKGTHWVRMEALRRDAQVLAEIFKMEFTYRPRSGVDNFNAAVHRLIIRGAVTQLYDDGYGERIQLLSTPQARRLVSLLRGMLLPFLDAYWVAALSLLPLQAEAKSGVVLRGHVQRMQKIAQTMYLENKVHSCEAASSETLCNALSVFEFVGIITRTPTPDGEALLRVRQDALLASARSLPRAPTSDPSSKPPLFASLVDAIRKLDAKRRVAATQMYEDTIVS